MSNDDVSMKLHIELEWNSRKSAEQFARYHRIVAAAQDMNMDVSVALHDQADEPSLSVVSNPLPPPRGRGRPRKATNGDAVNPVRQQVTAPSALSVDDVAGDEVPEDEVEDLGLKPPGMSPEDAHNFAMGGIRNAFNIGRKEEVYALRKRWGVTKFDEIPLDQGHALYKDVAALLEKVGMHL